VVAGPDCITFLQRILSQDMETVAEGAGTEAFFLTPKGKYIALMTLLHRGDHFLVCCPGAIREELAKKLSMYTLGTKAEVEDATGMLDLLTVAGPKAPEILAAAGATGLPETRLASAMAPVGGYEVTVCRTDRLKTASFDLHFPGSIREAVESALRNAGAVPVSGATAEALRIEAGEPRHGAEMDESLLPPEIPALVSRAISYTKGCYVGQETIARIKTYGHVNRELRGLLPSGDEVPEPGTELTAEGKKVGSITSSCLSPAFGVPIALGFVKRQHFEPGTVLTFEGGTAKVVPPGGPWE
jgi:folate-binding protein YgfZ